MERLSLPAEVSATPGQRVAMPTSVARPELVGTPVTGTDLRWYLGALRRHLRLVVLVAVAATAVAAVLAYSAAPRYTAWALIRLQDSRAPLVQGLLDPMEAGPRTLADPILSEIQVLTSRSVAAQIVAHPEAAPLRVHPVGFPFALLDGVRVADGVREDTLQLRFDERAFVVTGRATTRRASYGTPVEIDGLRFTLTAPPASRTALMVVVPLAAAVDSLLGMLDVSPRTRTDLLDVGVTSHDAVAATSIANAAVQVFREVSVESAQQQARRRREFMEEQLRQNDSILTIAQRALSGFRGRHHAYSSQQMFAAGQEGIAGLELQRVDLEIEHRTYQALLAELTQAADGGGRVRVGALAPGVAPNPVVAQLYTQLLRHQAAYDSLTTGDYRSAENSPDVRRLVALLASTRDQLVEAVRSYIGALGARLTVLDGVQAARAAAFQSLPAAEVEEARLATRLDALRQVGEQLRGEYQRARIDEAVEAGRLSVIDLATLPRAPVGASPLTKVSLGLVLGLMLGGGAAFLREAFSSVIRRREDVEAALQLPWLAVIPRIRPLRDDARRPQVTDGTSHWRKAQRLRSRLLRVPFADPASERAIAADAFRLLQVNLAFASEGPMPSVVAVTSPTAGDGKTTTAINLAVAYAEQGRRVLLVDCDLRRPCLHRLSGRARDPGLVELLLGRSNEGEAVRPLGNDLWLLAAGAVTSNPPALLGSAPMHALLDRLVHDYDAVVLDCPPVLLGADAALVGAAAGGVLFVVRAGRTDRELAQHGLDQLRRVGAHVLGVVLNDPETLVPQYSYDVYEAYADSYHAAEQVVPLSVPAATSTSVGRR